MRIGAFTSGVVLLWAAAAQAEGVWENRCLEVTWKTNEQLMARLNEQGAQGWQLGSFIKGSRPCLKRRKTAPAAVEHMCTTYRWRNVEELTRVLNDYSDQGWELVGSSRPSQLCMVRASGAAIEVPKARPPAMEAESAAPHPPAVAAQPGESQAKPAAKPKAQSPEDKTRSNAKEMHKQLSKEELKRQLAAGEISQEEYDARIKEIEQP